MDESELEKRKEFEKYKQRKKRCLIKNSYIPMKLRKMIHPLLHVMLMISRKSHGYNIEIINKHDMQKWMNHFSKFHRDI